MGAFELLTAVVFAQHLCRDQALRRVSLSKELQLEMGSRRFPADWLRDRLKWLTQSGEPPKPNWELSQAAASFSELQTRDYYNPEEDAENEVDESPDVNFPWKMSLSSLCRTASA